MDEGRAIEQHVMAQFRASAALVALVADRFYREPAPEGVDYPFVSFRSYGDRPVMVHGSGDIVVNQPSYTIKGVTPEESALVGHQIAAFIYVALVDQEAQLTIDTVVYNIQGAWRETRVDYSEDIDGVRYHHIGGVYRFFVSKG